MPRFLKGLVTGTVLGAIVGMTMSPKGKSELKKTISLIDDNRIKKRSVRLVKGMAKAMNKVMK